MKTKFVHTPLVFSFFVFYSLLLLHADTTITDTNHFAYGANVGWIECRGDVANGAVVGEYVCSGNILAANVGWISLGNGSPANGIRYKTIPTTTEA